VDAIFILGVRTGRSLAAFDEHLGFVAGKDAKGDLLQMVFAHRIEELLVADELMLVDYEVGLLRAQLLRLPHRIAERSQRLRRRAAKTPPAALAAGHDRQRGDQEGRHKTLEVCSTYHVPTPLRGSFGSSA